MTTNSDFLILSAIKDFPPDLGRNTTFHFKSEKAWTLLKILSPYVQQPEISLLAIAMKSADSDSKPNPNPPDSRVTLETIISVGVVGWLVIGMVLMGLGVW